MCPKLSPTVFLFGLLLLAPSQLLSQTQPIIGQISGQVRYADSSQPAFNVLVRCDSISSGFCGQETTDRSGRFRFTGLDRPQYTITVRVPGYIEQRQDVELATSPNAYLQFQLRPDGTAKPAASAASILDANVPAGAKKEYDQAAAGLATGKKEGIEEAVKHLEKAVGIYPNFVQAQLMLGTAYMDLGQLDKAEVALNKTRQLDPKAANALFALGELYLRQKKDEDAEKFLVQGLELESRSYQAHLSLARVYLDMASKIKDETQARPSLENAYDHVNQSLKINPDLAPAHLLKGNLLLRVRRAADAQREFEEYLRLDPKGPLADQTRTVVEKIKKALESEKKP
ncbi:MAG TPA: tetratricopeptide repeat protein [Pyrinomonadaceae bacterium]|nr:tetratricopeptide repeat protein [Pyrinomonadaceae bacterium]